MHTNPCHHFTRIQKYRLVRTVTNRDPGRTDSPLCAEEGHRYFVLIKWAVDELSRVLCIIDDAKSHMTVMIIPQTDGKEPILWPHLRQDIFHQGHWLRKVGTTPLFRFSWTQPQDAFHGRVGAHVDVRFRSDSDRLSYVHPFEPERSRASISLRAFHAADITNLE